MKITFFSSNSGRSYFENFLKALHQQDKAVILATLSNIQLHGLNAKGCDFRQIEGKLWEIRIKTPNAGYRFFYILIASHHIHILHSYKKQSQKAPTKELDIARKRLKEVLNES